MYYFILSSVNEICLNRSSVAYCFLMRITADNEQYTIVRNCSIDQTAQNTNKRNTIIYYRLIDDCSFTPLVFILFYFSMKRKRTQDGKIATKSTRDEGRTRDPNYGVVEDRVKDRLSINPRSGVALK